MIYLGTVHTAIPPTDSRNYAKTQYEYVVGCTDALFSTTIFNHCIRAESFGTADNFDDMVLRPGQRVLVHCLFGNKASPIIIGYIRASHLVQSSNPKHLRFNAIEQIFGADKSWTVKTDAGSKIQVHPERILIDDGGTESIILDRTKKTLTINAQDLTIKVKGNARVDVSGNSTINTKGETKIISKIIKFMKGENEETIEPFVLGKVFVEMMKKLIVAISTHMHLGNLGANTSPALNAADFLAIVASPLSDKKILSDYIKGGK
jgi:hypothetical protein